MSTTNDGAYASTTLDRATIGEALNVLKIQAPQQAQEWERWLEEIGFVPGEQVCLMARAVPGGDPLVVRVGQSTFALRRAEAACISVAPIGAAAHSPSFAGALMQGERA